MILYIVHHAWAGHFGDPQWPDDFQRPLSESGVERFGPFVEKLAARGFLPQVVGTSPMVRCRQTAEMVAEGVDKAGAATGSEHRAELVELDALMPGGSFDELMAWTAEQSRHHQQIAWVGHAPGIGRLAAVMIGSSDGWIRFAKGAVAAVQFEAEPRPGEGELRWLLTAKMLGC